MISNVLNTEGVSSALLGREWTPLLDRALPIALDESLQAGAAFIPHECRSHVVPAA